MTNSILLGKEILNSGMTIVSIASKIGISREGFYNKMNGKTEFKASEIVAIQDMLHLTKETRDAIFFGEKVECKATFEKGMKGVNK